MDLAELFSKIDDDMKATGFFDLIQNNLTDIVVGFSILTHLRGAAFEYIYAHLAYTDDFMYRKPVTYQFG